jgi:hypothetical protein
MTIPYLRQQTEDALLCVALWGILSLALFIKIVRKPVLSLKKKANFV